MRFGLVAMVCPQGAPFRSVRLFGVAPHLSLWFVGRACSIGDRAKPCCDSLRTRIAAINVAEQVFYALFGIGPGFHRAASFGCKALALIAFKKVPSQFDLGSAFVLDQTHAPNQGTGLLKRDREKAKAMPVPVADAREEPKPSLLCRDRFALRDHRRRAGHETGERG